MKRSAPPRRKAGLSPGARLVRLTALDMRAGLARARAPLARMSQRTIDQLPERQAVVRQVWARDKHCVARDLVPTVPCTGELEVDEICPRSACPGGHLNPDNCQLLCRGHHRWKHLNPRRAAALGLRRWSWQVDRTGWVIGCVWGAWRQLVEKLGPDCAPNYAWCEKEWRAAPQDQLPPVGSKALPDALTRYLEDLWQTRGQPSLF